MTRFVVITLALAACVTPEVVTCEDGSLCPLGTTCAVGGGCRDPNTPAGCGNHVVEDLEVCDDGNRTSGDGCSDDCRSMETCANSIVDLGEECDDGNLLSRDGCDSQCRRETSTWQLVPLGISPGRGGAVFDDRRGVLVASTAAGTWELAADRWSLTAGAINATATCLALDATGLVRIASSTTTQTLQRYDGHGWTELPTTGAPITTATNAFVCAAAAYEPSSDRLLVTVSPRVGGGFILLAIDRDGVWSVLPEPPPGRWLVETGGVIYSARLGGTTEPIVARLDGTAITMLPAPPGTYTAAAAVAGELWLVGDADTVAWRGGAWAPVGLGAPISSDNGRSNAFTDAAGTFSVLDDSRLWRFASGSWSVAPVYVTGGALAIASPSALEMVGGSPGRPALDVWPIAADGALGLPVPQSDLAQRTDAQTAYSSGRAATLLFDGCPTCVARPLVRGPDGHWATPAALQPAVPPAGGRIVYVPPAHAIEAVADGGVFALADDAVAWTQINLAVASTPVSIAWDARNDRLVIGQFPEFGIVLYELVSNVLAGWQPLDLAPSTNLAVVTHERNGSILGVELGGTTTWERIGGDWFAREPIPAPIAIGAAVTVPATGDIAALGSAYGGQVLAIRRTTSATPLETCTDLAADLDGDGLAGCDDPDCYWACSLCPPLTTCE